MPFGPLLKNIRERNRLSQEEIARVLGISRTTVGEIEKDGRDISYQELHALAAYLRVNVVDLLANDVEPGARLAKYQEMLLYTALSYHRATGKDLPKTFLAKIVYLADFTWFYEHLEPMSGMCYYRREHGPVANEYFTALGTLVENGQLQTRQGKHAHWYRPTIDAERPFVAQYLSQGETQTIDRIVERWKDASTAQIVEFTHSQLPWQICLPNEPIPYSLITQEEPERVY